MVSSGGSSIIVSSFAFRGNKSTLGHGHRNVDALTDDADQGAVRQQDVTQPDVEATMIRRRALFFAAPMCQALRWT